MSPLLPWPIDYPRGEAWKLDEQLARFCADHEGQRWELFFEPLRSADRSGWVLFRMPPDGAAAAAQPQASEFAAGEPDGSEEYWPPTEWVVALLVPHRREWALSQVELYVQSLRERVELRASEASEAVSAGRFDPRLVQLFHSLAADTQALAYAQQDLMRAQARA